MIIQTKELTQIREALILARNRIFYLGVNCTNPKHYEANEATFLPAIDRAIAVVGSPKEQ